jgi:biotin carboxyl carrier protein
MALEVITSPLPGKIISVDVKAGQHVKEGAVLLIIEAMKMENEIVAPVTGTVKTVSVAPSATVQIGDDLISIEEG